MKKVLLFALTCLCVCFVFCACGRQESIVGKWVDIETSNVIEFTADGYYYEYANEILLDDLTKYELSGNKITFYIEEDRKNTAFSVEFEINKDGNLVINDVIIYRPYEENTGAEK